MTTKRKESPKLFGDFVPLASLWNGRIEGLFSSEPSARWFIYRNREALLKAEAVAIHVGCMWVHPERFTEAARRIAVAAAQRSLMRNAGAA